MKKICRTIKLRKYKCEINEDSIKQQKGKEFIVCFCDGKYLFAYEETMGDLRRYLEKDYIRRIRYIFDLTDRIIIDRDILIHTDELKDSDIK